MDTERPPTLADLLAHERFVRTLARRLLSEDPHEAEDLTQDVWSAALQRPPSHRHGLKAWLRAVVLALYSNRRRKRSPQVDEAIGEREHPESATWEQIEFAEVRRAVARTVHELREPYREVLLLRFYGAFPPREVARRLGRPVQTVHTQTKRGLALVRQALQREGKGDPRSALLLLSARPERARLERLCVPAAGAAAVVGAFVALRTVLPYPGPIEVTAAAPPVAAPTSSLQESEVSPGAAAAADAARTPMSVAPSAVGTPEVVAFTAVDGTRSLQVSVLDASGRAVPDAAVLVLLEEGWTERGRTDERGQAELRIPAAELGLGMLPSGFALVRAEAGGRATLQEAGVDLDQRSSASVSFELGDSAATLAGQVVDLDAIAVPDARVLVLPARIPTGSGKGGAIYRAARHETRTDELGSFSIPNLAAGRVQVLLAHTDLGIHRLEMDLAQDAPPAELRFTPGCVVLGTVNDANGAPAAGAEVGALWQAVGLPSDWTDTVADAEGRFALAMPADPRLQLWARAKGSPELLASQVVDARSGAELEWNPTLRRWPPVRVRLVDTHGEPVDGWQVVLRPDDPREVRWAAMKTGADGRAALRLAVDGALRIEVFGPLTAERKSVVAARSGVLASDELEHEIEVDPLPSARASLAARLVGRAFELPGDLMVALEQEGSRQQVRMRADSIGGVHAEGLAAGRYFVLATSGEALMARLAVAELTEGRALDLGTLALEAPAQLDLSRLGSAEVLELWLEPNDCPPLACWRGSGGRAQPLSIWPGSYRLTRAAGSEAQEDLRFETPPGGRVEVGADFRVR